MTRPIESLAEIAGSYDAIVLDQWGVLHDGGRPYPGAIEALERLAASGMPLAVLSNSGKRAAPNAARIAGMGFSPDLFKEVMSSGEALWRDIQAGVIAQTRFLAIERDAGDAAAWAKGLSVTLVDDVRDADAILLMGLPDDAVPDIWAAVEPTALSNGMPVFCSNPDRASPRPGGGIVVSPGALAHAFHDKGGDVMFYGKPHLPIFQAVQRALGVRRLLMVGDSLEHDIAGAATASWDSLLITGGLYAAEFAGADRDQTLSRLIKEKAAPAPTYIMDSLR